MDYYVPPSGVGISLARPSREDYHQGGGGKASHVANGYRVVGSVFFGCFFLTSV